MPTPNWSGAIPADFRTRLQTQTMELVPVRLDIVRLLDQFFAVCPDKSLTAREKRAILLYLQATSQADFFAKQGTTTGLELKVPWFLESVGERYDTPAPTTPLLSFAPQKIARSQQWVYALLARFFEAEQLVESLAARLETLEGVDNPFASFESSLTIGLEPRKLHSVLGSWSLTKLARTLETLESKVRREDAVRYRAWWSILADYTGYRLQLSRIRIERETL